jgi:hypothetical protein
MVNATCDLCYRKSPTAGYFKVLSALKSSLCIREGSDLNTICGEHFADTDIAESEARPVFLPRLSTVAHDHPYVVPGEVQGDNKGISLFTCVSNITFGALFNSMKQQTGAELCQVQSKLGKHDRVCSLNFNFHAEMLNKNICQNVVVCTQ